MHDREVKETLMTKIRKHINKLLGFAKNYKTRLTFRAEQIYVWSVFRFYHLPLYACEILSREELESAWTDYQYQLHASRLRTIGKAIISTLLP
jgi:hypothetical protein